MASGSAASPGPHVTGDLVAETRTVTPGQTLQLALRERIQPGWHTYWSNPGDAGVPTEIAWDLPPGLRAGPIAWPTPRRFAVGPVVDYGYENEVVLPVSIDVPSTLAVGGEVVVSAHVSWLVCSDICVPEETRLTLTLPVSATPRADPAGTAALDANRARLPMPDPFPTRATWADGKVVLRVETGDAGRLRDLMFFPAGPNMIDDTAAQEVRTGPAGVTLTLPLPLPLPRRAEGSSAAGNAISPPPSLDGLLVFRDTASSGEALPQAITIATPLLPGVPMEGGAPGFASALLLALVGGLLLNLMPCVLPVLSLKALGLVEQARASPAAGRWHGIAYGIGVLASFALTAALLIGLRAAGAEVGWGFQLQSPVFVAAMIYLLFAVGLNLSGVFAFGDRIAGVAGGIGARAGYGGSALTGALATLVATPCTGPFMAAALGYAITKPWYQSLAIFEAVGLGLALPYVAIAFSPGLRRFLPKPGPWMVHLRQFLAFPIYATAVWLMFVLQQEAGSLAATGVLAGLVCLAFAAWLYGVVRLREGGAGRAGMVISALAVCAALGLMVPVAFDAPSGDRPGEAQGGLAWMPFSAKAVADLQAQGKPVFVDFTADWCITCKLNERIALMDPAVVQAFAQRGVTALRADWTRQDAAITRSLEERGRAGVPLYLLYPPSDGETRQAIVLPQILTAQTVLDGLARR